MRILYHHRTLGDGAEGVHIAAMVDAFRALGHHVDVSGPRGVREDTAPGSYADWFRARIPDVAMEIAALAYNGVEWASLARTMVRDRLDIVYKRHARFDIAPMSVAARRGIPVILEVNAVYSTPPYCDLEPLVLRGVARRLECRAFDLATVIVAVSTPMAREVRRLSSTPVIVLSNAVDTVRFSPQSADPHRVRRAFGLNAEFVVGWTGVLREWHGLELLLEAIHTIPDARLLIVGDGPARASLERSAAALGIRDRLTITGRVPHAEVPDYLAAMDVAVVADERTRVASPMKLLEYMAMSRPVVAPRLDGITDIVTDKENGILFDPGDVQQLAAVLRQLAADQSRRLELGRQARKAVEIERTWRRNAERALEALRQARGPGVMPTL